MKRILTVVCAAVLATAASGTEAEQAAGTLITNAFVVDGTGTPPRRLAVRIAGERIAAVGELKPEPGETVVDARGLTLAPGFIDTHSHHDAGSASSATRWRRSARGSPPSSSVRTAGPRFRCWTFFGGLEKAPAGRERRVIRRVTAPCAGV